MKLPFVLSEIALKVICDATAFMPDVSLLEIGFRFGLNRQDTSNRQDGQRSFDSLAEKVTSKLNG